MGNRAKVYIKDGDYDFAECGMYLHWNGHNVLDWLQESLVNLRRSDPSYSMARLIGFFNNKIEGNIGLGVCSSPKSLEELETNIDKYSDGDFGCCVLDCRTGIIKCYGGYSKTDKRNNTKLGEIGEDRFR